MMTGHLSVMTPAQAWRQLSHWLVNDVPRRVNVRVEKGGRTRVNRSL